MSTMWFYLSSGWLRKGRRVGPISESDLLARIENGEIAPETLVQSSKTRGKWIPMNKVGPAMARWKKIHSEQAGERSE